MTTQLKEDIAESQVNESEIEDLDFDVKEALQPKAEWFEGEAVCTSCKSK